MPLGPVALAASIPVAGIPAVTPVEATNTAITNPIGAPTGGNAWSISGSQFLAARFAVATTTRLVAATAEFSFHGSGNLFVAVVPLASLTALPVGASVQETPFNPGEVAFSTTFTRANTGGGIETVPLNFDVPSGVYGIVFGSGFFGATGAAGMPPYSAATGSTGFLRNGPPGGSYVWRDTGSTQFNIGIVTAPAVATPVITAVTLPRQVVNPGQTLTLAATVTGATSLQWHRNGRPIAGATAAAYSVAGAAHQRDAGWYRLVASNAGGATTSPVVFVNVAATEVVAWGDNSSRQLEVPANLGAVTAVSAGFAHALALKADGTVVAWGLNNFGQTAVPAGLTGVVAIAAANSCSLALQADGTVVGWGNTTVPTGLTQVVALAADGHVLALRADGTVAAWGGSNSFGQLDVPAGLSGVVGIAAALNGSLALKADGTVVAWGSNIYGQANVPAGLANVVAVANADRGYALKADGTVATWGAGLNVGQTRLPDGTASVAVLAARATGSSVVYANGTVGTWGAAIPPAGLDRVVALAQGDSFLLALRDGSASAAPLITLHPISATTFSITGNTTFRVEATGMPAPTFRWQRQPDGATDFANLADSPWFIGAATNNLAVMAPTPVMHGDRFRCVATNPGGTATSAAATLSVLEPPAIVLQPIDATVTVGGNATFSVNVAGSPAPTLRWQRCEPGFANFNDLTDDATYAGVTSPTLSVSGATIAMHRDRFRVVAGNANGNQVSSVATLRVLPIDLIGTHPAGRVATVGQAAGFSVSAAGSGPFTYRWRRNGSVLPGATLATFGIPQARRSDAAAYDVEVTSGGRTEISQPARLLVAPTAYPGKIAFDPAFNLKVEAGGAVVNALAPLPDGRVIAAGDFVRVNGHVTGGVARFTAEGAVDPGFVAPDFDGAVWSLLVQADGKIVAGGDFNRVGEVDRPGFVRLNADGSIDATFGPQPGGGTLGVPSGVRAIVRLNDGRLLLGGPGMLVRCSASGILDSTYVSPVMFALPAISLARTADGRILVGGLLQAAFDGLPQLRLVVRLNPDGAFDSTFDSVALLNGFVSAVLPRSDGKVYVAGAMLGVPAIGQQALIRLNADGSHDSAFVASPAPTMVGQGGLALALDASERIYLAAPGGIARYGAAGAFDLVLPGFAAANVDGPVVSSILFHGAGALWVGGRFRNVGAVATEAVARFAPAAVVATAVGTAVDRRGRVASLVPDPQGRLLVGGEFRRLGGTAAAHLARITPQGAVEAGFAAGLGVDGSVTQILRLSDGRLMVLGAAATGSGAERTRLLRLAADGVVDSAFVFPLDGTLWGPVGVVEEVGGRLLLLGRHFSADFNSSKPMVRLNPDGSRDPAFSPGTPAEGAVVLGAVVRPDARLVAVGGFPQFNGNVRNGIVGLLPDGTSDPGFVTGNGFTFTGGGSGAVDLLAAAPGGRLLVAGPFDRYDAVPVGRVVRLQSDGALDSGFNVTAPHFALDGVRGQLMQEDGRVLVWVGAHPAYSPTAAPRLVRLTASGLLDPSFEFVGLRNTDRITAVALGDAGELYCALANRGEVRRSLALLAPIITAAPASQVAASGTTVTLSVTVTSTPAPSYRWFKNGTPLANATNPTLVLVGVNSSHAGAYTVAVTNEHGTTISPAATLIIGTVDGTAIVTQPVSQLVTAGQPATFGVGAVGPGTLNYLWRRNGTMIPGVTGPTLTLPSASRADADVYDVVVFPAAGGDAVTSAAVTLRVAPVSYPGFVAPDPAWDLRLENDSAAVTTLLRLPDGRCYAAGNFVRAAGLRLTGVLRLLADGSVDPAFQPPEIDNAVSALAVQGDGGLLVGGTFTRVGGVIRNRIARLLPNGSVDAAFNAGGTGCNNAVAAIAVDPLGRLLIGGSFNRYNGANTPGILRLLPDGTRDFSFAAGFSGVTALALLPDGRVLVAGSSTVTVGGLTYRYFVRFNPDGSPDTTLHAGAGFNSSIAVLQPQPDGKILVGGSFTTFDGAPANRLVRLNADGTRDGTFNPGSGFNGSVRGVELAADGRMLVWGSFTLVNELSRPWLVRLLGSGVVDGTFAPSNPAGIVNATVSMNDGSLLVAGWELFAELGKRYGLGRLAASGILDPAYDLHPRGGASIGSMVALPSGQVLLARSFAYARGQAVPARLGRFNVDGSLDPTFNPGGSGADNSIFALLRRGDGQLLIAGSFAQYNGVAAGGLARLTANGIRDPGFNATLSSGSSGIALAWHGGGRLLVGGSFITVNGVARAYLCRLDDNGALDTAFAPAVDATVSIVRPQPDGRIVIAGSFSNVNGLSVRRLARLNLDGTLDPSFQHSATLSAVIYDVGRLPDGRYLVAGSFTTYDGNTQTGLVRLSADGVFDPTFRPVLSGTVSCLLVQEDGKILVRGLFDAVDGAPGTAYLARLHGDGTPDASFGAGGFSPAALLYSQMLMTDSGRLFVPAATSVGLQVTRLAGAPLIATEPVNAAVFTGATATFVVAASSAAPLMYQWFRDDVPLPGANSPVLTLPAVNLADAGAYRAVVTSELGSVSTAVATLAVAGPPSILAPPVARTVGLGGLASFQVVVDGAGPFTYQWRRDGVPLSGATGSVLVLPEVSVAQAGGYTVAVTNPAGTTVSPAAALTVRPNPIAYSSLQDVGAGGTAGYFSIEGPQPKQVLLRAIGPGLPLMGAMPTLGDPHLSLHRAGGELFAANDDWSEGAGGNLATVFVQVGAMGLATGSRDAALVATLPPGSYFVRVSGVGGTTGLALLELYDTDLNPASRLAYVALRGRVNAGGAFSAGLTMTNSAAKRLLIRAVGPALGHSAALADPRLRVYDGATVAADNDNWGGLAALATAAELAGAFTLPNDSADAAVFFEQRVGAGVYTAEVSAGTSAGDVLLEFHDLKAAGASALAPLAVASPGPQTLAEDGAATLQVRALGREPLSYQWRRDGTAIPGATMSSLVLTAAEAAPGGSYDVAIENPLGLAVSPPALVTVGNRATHALGSAGYRAGATVTIDAILSYVGTVGSLGWAATLPDGWSYAGSAGAAGDVRPQAGDSGTLSWAWTAIPPSPVRFSFAVNVPATESGSRALTASAVVRPTGAAVVTLIALPDPLAIEEMVLHSADTDGNRRLGLIELTRVIELFNVRNGTTRTGAYAVAAGGSEDGFAPEPTRAASAVVSLARTHSADSNRDGKLSLLELTRVIEIYNFRSGTTRTGQYRVQPGTEDGFAPGP